MSLILDGTNGLSDVDGSAATPAIRGSDANTGVFFDSDVVGLSTDGSERVRVDASGNLGFGVTPSAWFANSRALQIGQGSAIEGRTNDATTITVGGNYYLDSAATYRYVTSNFAQRYTQAEGTHLWFTAPSGTAGDAISFSERARIDSSGNLLVGKTTTGTATQGFGIYSYGSFEFNCATAGTGGTLNRTDNGNLLSFMRSGATVGTISVTTTNTTYSTSSDYRLKYDIQPMTGALAKVAALKPCTYKWNTDDSTGEGFIAHELAEVVPGCVTGEKDGVETYTDDDGVEQTRPKYQGIDTSFLVATLTAAIQEQQAIITALTARVEALEGAQ